MKQKHMREVMSAAKNAAALSEKERERLRRRKAPQWGGARVADDSSEISSATYHGYRATDGTITFSCPFHEGDVHTCVWRPKLRTFRCDYCEKTGSVFVLVRSLAEMVRREGGAEKISPMEKSEYR